MVEKVSSEQAYINYVMKKLPDVARGEVHTMQRGDNLWNLAKKALNKKDATNQEISNYMLLIAKLNNLETVEEMNSLKISDKIYLPEVSAAKAIDSAQKQSVEKERTTAEISIQKLKDTILNDKTVFTEQAYPHFLNLYHVYHEYKDEKTGYHTFKGHVLSFSLDRNGNLKEVSFDDTEKRLNPIKLDYDMDAKGNIVIDNLGRKTPVGKIDKKELAELKTILENQAKNSKLSY